MRDDPAHNDNDELALMFIETAPAIEVTPRELVERPSDLSALTAEVRAEALAIVTRDERQAGPPVFDAARFILTEEDARLFLEASLKIGDADYVPYAEGVVTRAKLSDGWRG